MCPMFQTAFQYYKIELVVQIQSSLNFLQCPFGKRAFTTMMKLFTLTKSNIRQQIQMV